MKIENVLNIKFNNYQKRHAGAVRWLIGDGPIIKGNNIASNGRYRQTGRTYLFLSLIIEKALKNKGLEIPIYDHYWLNQGFKITSSIHILKTLETMLFKSNINKNLYTINRDRNTLKIC